MSLKYFRKTTASPNAPQVAATPSIVVLRESTQRTTKDSALQRFVTHFLHPIALGWWFLGLVPLVPFAYHCLFLTAHMSATPGQALFCLLVRRDDDLGPPTLPQAVISTLVFYLTLATTGLLLLVALFTQRNRTLHDLISGLVVVRRHAWHDWALTTGAGSWNMHPGHPHA
jgi:uncharacterized RDD family membrane protein YckC